jgi:hypothetical protein
MRRRLWAGLVLFAVVGCMAPGEVPPWQRPGLGGGEFTKALNKAVQDSRDGMTMQEDLPAERRHTEPRVPTAPDF